jgi:hypothetical protein
MQAEQGLYGGIVIQTNKDQQERLERQDGKQILRASLMRVDNT